MTSSAIAGLLSPNQFDITACTSEFRLAATASVKIVAA